jgi:hypothetical protein
MVHARFGWLTVVVWLLGVCGNYKGGVWRVYSMSMTDMPRGRGRVIYRYPPGVQLI